MEIEKMLTTKEREILALNILILDTIYRVWD